MATANNPRVVTMTCTICGESFGQAETAAIWLACRTCVRALILIASGRPAEVTPAVQAALERTKSSCRT